MKTSEYKGFKHVFKFTFCQSLRNSSFRTTMLILILLPMIIIPIYNYIQSGKDGNAENPIQKIYVINETEMTGIPYEASIEDEPKFQMEFEETDKTYEEMKEQISSEHSNDIILTMSRDPESGYFSLQFAHDPESEVGTSDVTAVAEHFSAWFEKYKLSVLDASPESLAMIQKKVDYEIIDTAEFLETDKKEVISSDDYNVVYALLMFVYIVVAIAAGNVASKVAEEKSNRVVEFLMTTIRPKALILGKVTASLLLTVGEIVLMLIGVYLSNLISCMVFGTDPSALLSGILSPEALKHFTLPNTILCIVVMALGIFIFGMVAGLFGASISKMEDLQQGLSTYNFIIIIAFLMCMTAAQLMWTVGIGGFVSFCLLFPLTSALLLPGAVMIGKVPLLMGLGSLAILIIVAILILKLVATIYESIIVMNGNPISPKEMIAIYKERRKQK